MKLQAIQADADALAMRLTSLLEGFQDRGPQGVGLYDHLKILIADATKLAKDSRQPSRLGLVGAFTVGKTRLLETLLGCAGRLGNLVDEKATSGNIAEFELRTANIPQTKIEEWKVVFMAEATDAARILRRLLLEARNEQNREGLSRLDALLFEAEFTEGKMPRWVKVQEWAKAAHAAARGRQLKTIAFEVYRLAYTVNHASDWLGREFIIEDEASALTLLTLSKDRSHYDRPLEEWKTQFPPAPTSSPGASGTAVLPNLPTAQLQSLFALVRKVQVRVTLPPFVAESLGSGAGLDMRIVDCPGADADETNFRDSVICAYELQDVDTVLVLMNAQRPSQKRAFLDDLLRIWGQQAKYRILVLISRFDLLPSKNPRELESLASGKGPLTAKELLTAMSNFDDLYHAALDTVLDQDPERISAVSTLGYLTERLLTEGLPQRGTAEFYSQELRYVSTNDPEATLKSQLSLPWAKCMESWAMVGQRLILSSDAESQSLGKLLSDFGSDGGFGRVQSILRHHLGQYATGHLVERLAIQLTGLKTRTEEIESALASLPVVPPATTKGAVPSTGDAPKLPSAGDALIELERKFQTFVNQVDTTERFRLELRAPGAATAEPMLPRLRRWLIAEINRWEEWRLLLNRVRSEEAGLIALLDRESPTLKQPGHEQDYEAALQTPVKSDDFLKPFQETLSVIQETLKEWCQSALQHHSEVLKRNLDGLLGTVRGPLLASALAPLGDEIKAALLPIHTSINKDWLKSPFEAPAKTAAPYLPYFPLQHGEGKPLYYVWHKPMYDKYRNDFDDRQRHIMYVVKLRQVILSSALAWLEESCHQIEELLKLRIKNHVKSLYGHLTAELKTQVPKKRVRSGPAT